MLKLSQHKLGRDERIRGIEFVLIFLNSRGTAIYVGVVRPLGFAI